jgi:hypothetical protein
MTDWSGAVTTCRTCRANPADEFGGECVVCIRDRHAEPTVERRGIQPHPHQLPPYGCRPTTIEQRGQRAAAAIMPSRE